MEHEVGDEAGAEARFLVAGDLVLDRRDQRAWLLAVPLQLGAKALTLLEELMMNPRLLVTKERLFDAAWPSQAVSDTVLTTAIRELRRALGDPARAPDWIETHHGKGYRFLKDVEALPVRPNPALSPAEGEAPLPVDGERRRSYRPLAIAGGALLLLGLVAAAVWAFLPAREQPEVSRDSVAGQTAPHRIAILPFEVASGEAWLGSAMANRLTDVLGRSPDFIVVDGQVAAALAQASEPWKAAGAEGIGTFVSGTVMVAGDSLQAMVTVHDAAGTEIWVRRLTDRGEGLISLTERVAFETARALKVAADPEKIAEMAEVGTASLAAFEAHARAVQILDSLEGFRNPDSVANAIEDLRRAVALDPTFAQAAKDLAWFTLPGPYSPDPATAEDRVFALLEMAARHAPNDWERRATRANLDLRHLRFEEARAELLALYEETRATSAPLNHSILTMLSYIAAAMRDRELMEWVWTELSDYNLARGRIQMKDPAYIADAPALLDRFVTYHQQQEPTPIGSYVLHSSLLLLGRTEEAASFLNGTVAAENGRYDSLMRVGQACAEARPDDARGLARRTIEAQGPSYIAWKVAQISGLGDQIERNRPVADGDARQRTLLVMLDDPGFDPRPYPLLAQALTEAGVDPVPLPRLSFYCPLTPASN
ncbi:MULTISPECIES: winged helix-turn-helix domain-containing protein [Pacificimonas]|nr:MULTISPECIES: winged helix-turn-helix domain-containing protein [Pacificimonas]MBZ6378755.1 winged helix-turn-helix domain-containing protein [Pacificimonas aurantium]